MAANVSAPNRRSAAGADVVGRQFVGVLPGDLACHAEVRRRDARRGTLFTRDVVLELCDEPLARGGESARRELILELADPAHANTASTAVANSRHSPRRSPGPLPERVSL